MRLKSIKIAGFKSFVDMTTVPFQSNMTAIVGPNGCGKSNVIDAVRWVMGESSAKHLRGESMTDVIFNGSVSRKPVSRASVELLFDNEDGRAAGEYARFSEIAVRRELTREGQSKYFLNGTVCRRRDVTDLFLGTGLGPRSYAVIEQGMIAKFVEARPEELRTYVEEAAGVSKYKERRRETELRISRTRENLERLSDLSDELGRQLGRLKRQADAAQEYKKVKVKIRNLKVLICRYQLQLENEKRHIQADEKNCCKKDLDQLANQLASNERARISIQVAREDTGRALDDANSLYYTHAATLSQMESKKDIYQQKIEQLDVKNNRIEREITELQVTTESDRADGIIAEQQKAQIEPQLKITQADLQALDQSIASFEEKLDEVDLQRGHLAVELNELGSEITRLEAEKMGLNRQQERELARLNEVNAALLKMSDADPRIIDACLADESLLSERLSLESVRGQEIQTKYDENSKLAAEKEDHLRDADAKFQLSRAQLEKALRILDIESRIEGQNIDGWISSQASIKGRLLEYVEVNPGDRLAFEVAYPEWLSAFVVDNIKDFDFESIPAGVRIVASEQVETLPKRLPKVSRPLMAGGEGYTESGLRFGPGWVERLTGHATGILDLKARLPDLQSAQHDAKEVTVQLDAQLIDLRQRCKQELMALKQQRQVVSVLETESIQLNNRLAGLEAKSQEIKDSRDRLSREQDLLATGQLTISAEIRRLGLRLIDLRATETVIQEKLRPLQDLISADKLSLMRLREERNNLINARSDLRVQMERFIGVKIRSDAQVQRTEAQVLALNNEFQKVLNQRQLSIDHPEVTEADINQAVKESQHLQNLLAAARKKLGEHEHVSRGLDAERLEIEGFREAKNKKLSEILLKEQAIKIELDRLYSEIKTKEVDEKLLTEIEANFGTIQKAEAELEKYLARIERLGSINLVALDEYQNELQRKAGLDHQHAELTEALKTLEDAIRKIDRETRHLFKNTFDAINQSFGDIFPKLFGGGEARLMLANEDLLSSGITIMARPPGKRNSSIYLLSGGEKALTALSLVFSIFHLNPAPFCLLDEVDAPLDDANVARYANAVANMSQAVQFIYITHNKIAMEYSEHLLGVTMSEPGVSRLVSVDIERAIELSTSE